MRSGKTLAASLLTIALLSGAHASLSSDDMDAADSIDRLLEQFDAAIASANVKQLEALFLPPDKTENGRNREANLAEARKDWTDAKSGPPVNLIPTRALIHIDMENLDPDSPIGARISKVELEVVSTDDGWRIEAMRNVAKKKDGEQ